MLSRRKRLGLAIVLSALIGCNGNYNSGDRVLVEKFAYDADVGSPNRFDVVVFKFPERPIKNSTPTNYIKRLLGLPGELIAILCGQLFVFHPDPSDPPLFDDVNNKDIPANDLWKPAHLHSTVYASHATEPAGHIKMRRLFEQGKFTIVRKPPEVMLAMRRIVNDNDFQPADLKTKRWAPAKTSSWAADDNKGFTHKGDASKTDWLRYQHITRPVNGPQQERTQPELITDAMDYNSIIVEKRDFQGNLLPPDDKPVNFSGFNWVGDLMIECELNVVKAEGEFRLELNRGIHRYQARIDLANGQCSLFKVSRDDKEEQLGKTVATRVSAPGKYNLRLANFDARLTLWVDHDLPFGDGQEYPPPEMRSSAEAALDDAALAERRGPWDDDKKGDLHPVGIGIRGAEVAVHHLRVSRDTYYTLMPGLPDLSSVEENITRQKYLLDSVKEELEKKLEDVNRQKRLLEGKEELDKKLLTAVSNEADRLHKEIDRNARFKKRLTNQAEVLKEWTTANDKYWGDANWGDPRKWGVFQEQGLKIMYVQPGHYLCLGDNSSQSSDGREWGLVPKRLMLGRALMVYYPLNRAGPIR